MQIGALERLFSPSTLTIVNDPLLKRHGIELWMKRDDLLHPVISGNKWRKLKYSMIDALQLETRNIISMGGAYSNHLHALAYTCKCLGLESAAFIRGERPHQFNQTLDDLRQWGMKLTFVPRSEYRQLRQYKGHDSLPGMAAGEYWLPEGGSTHLALPGVAEIVAEISRPYDVICVPCGTGTTLAGLLLAVPENVKVLGVAVLKGAQFLYDDIGQFVHSTYIARLDLQMGYHFGGFAKADKELLTFIDDFFYRYAIALEPVYSGKMMYALFDLVRQGYFSRGQRIIAVHTGGLQGCRR